MGEAQDMVEPVLEGNVDAISMAHILHYNKANLSDIRNRARENKIIIRNFYG